MSRFMSPRFAGLEAYTPGEQPRDQQYVKLNTNESPYPPSPEVVAAVSQAEVSAAVLPAAAVPQAAGNHQRCNNSRRAVKNVATTAMMAAAHQPTNVESNAAAMLMANA